MVKTLEVEVLDAPSMEGLAELQEREDRIERAQRNAYYEIGLDLKGIRDKKLYRIERPQPIAGRYSFQTFEEYVEERWEIKRTRAFELIQSAETADGMKTSGKPNILPARESHVRPLLKLETDAERAAVWQAVIERGETIKAKLVEEEVEVFLARKAQDWVTLAEWNEMDEDKQASLWQWKSDKTFNRQANDAHTVDEGGSIEWAQWSWNPVTGCEHGCEYCYARDIAKRFYQHGFAPTLYPGRLACPANTKLPKGAENNIGLRNVFATSMGDLFGKWVPKEWILAVLSRAANAPQWNFLFLTKNPARLTEFKFPKNAWVGTTVDTQARVKPAEKAFAKIDATVKFLSVEPLLEDLTFGHLDYFDWVIIGGGSRSSETDEYHPSRELVNHLHAQARAAGCKIYEKPNLLERIKEYPDCH